MNREEGRIFGTISELYGRARTNYPDALIDQIVAFSGLQQGTVLDIGCGTGQATIPFAQRGFHVTGLDVSANMVAVAQRNCGPSVDFKVGTFEDVDLHEKSFGLVVSCMAWHWVAPERAYSKLHKILQDNGSVALVWYHQEGNKSDLVSTIAEIIVRYEGTQRGPTGKKVVGHAHAAFDTLRGGEFRSVELRKYEETVLFTSEQYTDLLLSYGWVQRLLPEKRKNLVEEVQAVCKKYAEPFVVPYTYLLVLAKKK